MFLTATALVALVGSTAALTPAVTIAEPNPKAMSQAEIRAFNAKLDKDHKYFIRCKRSAAIGSLVARNYSCRTNAQWLAADARGNQESRDIIDEMTSKSANTSN